MRRVVLLLVTTALIPSLLHAELALTALPDVLFNMNGGVHKVAVGSVLRIHCSASSSSSIPVITWLRNYTTLISNPPHLRIFTHSDGTAARSTLVIDPFGASDSAEYACSASDGETVNVSTPLTLTDVNDGMLYIVRDPVERETVNIYDNFQDNRTGVENGTDFEPDSVFDMTCCQVLRCLAAVPGNTTGPASVTWIRDGEEVHPEPNRTLVENVVRYQTGPNETRLRSDLRFTPFELDDIGVYQCVFFDSNLDGEIITTTPLRLDSGEELHLQRVSPDFIVLRPPEKLVLETKASGRYEKIVWSRNGVEYGEPGFAVSMPQEFPEFYEMFVRDPTSSDDFGMYSVTLTPVNGSQQECSQTNITVIPYSPPVTHSPIEDGVTLISGESINISCISYGSPIPSIAWFYENSESSFMQVDTVLEHMALSPSRGEFNFSVGGIESTLVIKDAQYPKDSGIYTCNASNEHAGSISSNSTSILVQVQVVPEIEVNATQDVVNVGEVITLTCIITRSIPSNISEYQWRLFGPNGTRDLMEANSQLEVNVTSNADYGTYICSATNAANLTGEGNLTIQQPVAPEITTVPLDTVVTVSETITLTCAAKGVPLPVITWWKVTDTSVVRVMGERISVNEEREEEEIRSTLVITMAQIEDTGKYICRAENYVHTEEHMAIVTVGLLRKALFQVRFSPINSCTSWVVTDRNTKLQDITSSIASAIRRLCSCEFHTTNIINQTFYCGELEHSVVFRAQISYIDFSGNRTSASFVAQIETWLQNGATLHVNGSVVLGDTTCPPQVNSLEDRSCLSTTSSEGTDPIVFIISAVVVAMVTVFLTTCTILVLLCRRRARMKNALEHSTSAIVFNGPKAGNQLSDECSGEFVDNPQYGKHNYYGVNVLEGSVTISLEDNVAYMQVPGSSPTVTTQLTTMYGMYDENDPIYSEAVDL